jgi:glutamate synthase (NADPH/NADH) large chain
MKTEQDKAAAADRFVERYERDADRLRDEAVIDVDARDACGVGLIAAIDGEPSRQVVEAGIEALKALWHRGAVDADGMTGDGAGIMVEIPQDFFRDHVSRTGHTASAGPIAVGMTFLPRTDLEAQERCRFIVESEILKFGYSIYG